MLRFAALKFDVFSELTRLNRSIDREETMKAVRVLTFHSILDKFGEAMSDSESLKSLTEENLSLKKQILSDSDRVKSSVEEKLR